MSTCEPNFNLIVVKIDKTLKNYRDNTNLCQFENEQKSFGEMELKCRIVLGVFFVRGNYNLINGT